MSRVTGEKSAEVQCIVRSFIRSLPTRNTHRDNLVLFYDTNLKKLSKLQGDSVFLSFCFYHHLIAKFQITLLFGEERNICMIARMMIFVGTLFKSRTNLMNLLTSSNGGRNLLQRHHLVIGRRWNVRIDELLLAPRLSHQIRDRHETPSHVS